MRKQKTTYNTDSAQIPKSHQEKWEKDYAFNKYIINDVMMNKILSRMHNVICLKSKLKQID